MKKSILFIIAGLSIYIFNSSIFRQASSSSVTAQIPLPENPRPDFERSDWINLNGPWQFRFDKENAGLDKIVSQKS